MNESTHRKMEANTLQPLLNDASINNPFYNKKIVLTGKLKSLDRRTAVHLLNKLGADVISSVSTNTEILIIGDRCDPSKLDRIIDLIDEGVSIKLMNERIFTKEVDPYKHIINAI